MTITIEEIQASITGILEQAYSVEFHIIELIDDTFAMHHLNIGQGETYERISKEYTKSLTEELLDNESLVIQDIYNIDQRKDVVYQIEDISYIPRLQAINELLLKNKTNPDPPSSKFNPSRIWGFLIHIGRDSESIILFKKHYPINTLKQNVFLLRFLDDSLLLVDNETNIRFNTDFHCFHVNGSWFVKDLSTFEKQFQFEEIEIKRAREDFTKIFDLQLVQDNQNLFETCLGKRIFARKVMRIISSSQVLQRGISNKDILAFSKEFEIYRGKFKYASDGKIILSSQKDFNLYLKLMNDDYLVSRLTEAVYDTEVKTAEA